MPKTVPIDHFLTQKVSGPPGAVWDLRRHKNGFLGPRIKTLGQVGYFQFPVRGKSFNLRDPKAPCTRPAKFFFFALFGRFCADAGGFRILTIFFPLFFFWSKNLFKKRTYSETSKMAEKRFGPTFRSFFSKILGKSQKKKCTFFRKVSKTSKNGFFRVFSGFSAFFGFFGTF